MSKAEDIMERLKDLQSSMNVLLEFWRGTIGLERLYMDLANRLDLKIKIYKDCIYKIKRRRSIKTLLKDLESEVMKLENTRKVMEKYDRNKD